MIVVSQKSERSACAGRRMCAGNLPKQSQMPFHHRSKSSPITLGECSIGTDIAGNGRVWKTDIRHLNTFDSRYKHAEDGGMRMGVAVGTVG